MKTGSTIYLEEMFWDMIKQYQIDNNIASRNDAIQLMLHELSILKGSNMTVSNNVVKTETSKSKTETVEKKEVKEIDPKIASGFLKIKGSMK